MTRVSQDMWEHSVPKNVSCTSARVSFTFRKLDPNYNYTPPPHRPPIREYVSNSNTPIISKPKRVLLLTDSVISGFPVNYFDSTGAICIKKTPVDKKLVNIDSFESEFCYTDYVVISAGINDLSRYGQTGESLSSFMSAKIRDWTSKYPKTVFLFNSILHTDRRYGWLNDRVDIVNRAMFDLSVELYHQNFWFLDTHASLVGKGTQFPILSPSGNGIHLSYRACVYISRVICDSVTALSDNSPATPRLWPLRPEYRRLISGDRHPNNRGRVPFVSQRSSGPRL